MAVYVVDGRIGAGKTYFTVNHFARKFYMWDELIDEWVPRKPLVLISNIDGLRLEHVELKAEIEKRGVAGVFCDAFIDEMRSLYRCRSVIIAMDEAQKVFDRKFYDKSVFGFFQTSRHAGVGIYLITQDVSTMAKELQNLAEKTYHARPRTLGSGITFSYQVMDGYEVVGRKELRKDKRIFSAYKSFSVEEVEAPRPVFLKYVAMVVGLCILIVVMYKYVFLENFRGDKKKAEPASVSKPVKASSPSPVNSVQYRHLSDGRRELVEGSAVPGSGSSVPGSLPAPSSGAMPPRSSVDLPYGAGRVGGQSSFVANPAASFQAAFPVSSGFQPNGVTSFRMSGNPSRSVLPVSEGAGIDPVESGVGGLLDSGRAYVRIDSRAYDGCRVISDVWESFPERRLTKKLCGEKVVIFIDGKRVIWDGLRRYDLASYSGPGGGALPSATTEGPGPVDLKNNPNNSYKISFEMEKQENMGGFDGALSSDSTFGNE